MQQRTFYDWLAYGILVINVVFYLGVGLLIIIAPVWFHGAANFPPFNRHYLGDGGVFQMALGFGLLWALLSPVERVSHIWVGTIAGTLHAGNHLYDILFVSTPSLLSYWIPQTTSLIISAISLLAIAIGYSNKKDSLHHPVQMSTTTR